MEHYTESQLTEFKDAFNLFDKELKGFITSSEIAKIVNMFGTPASSEAIQKLMEDYDKNANGELDFPEFVEMMAKNNITLSNIGEENIRDAFRAFDRDHNGLIDKAELMLVMKNLGEKITEKDIEDMIKEGDLDEDGKINFDEFMIIMSSK